MAVASAEGFQFSERLFLPMNVLYAHKENNRDNLAPWKWCFVEREYDDALKTCKGNFWACSQTSPLPSVQQKPWGLEKMRWALWSLTSPGSPHETRESKNQECLSETRFSSTRYEFLPNVINLDSILDLLKSFQLFSLKKKRHLCKNKTMPLFHFLPCV